MKFNICYCGPEWLFHLRRDFILVLKYSLEDLGHDVILSGPSLDAQRFNFIIGAYFLKPDSLKAIAQSGVKYAHVNTEPISNNTLNHNPDKVDFLGSYLPSMKAGAFVWDVIMDNLVEYQKHDVNANFLRWGSHPKLQDIEHRQEKDLDFYFFGMISERRKGILQSLLAAGLTGVADHSCPYFLRNDRIARTRVQLNLIQTDKYTHVNSFRICYLADNSCCIVSENEIDPANYLQYAEVVTQDQIIDTVRGLIQNNRWLESGERAKAAFAKIPMNRVMEEVLDCSFPGAKR